MSPYSLFLPTFQTKSEEGMSKIFFYYFLLIDHFCKYASTSTKTYSEKVKEVGKKVHIHFLKKVVSEKQFAFTENSKTGSNSDSDSKTSDTAKTVIATKGDLS